MYRLCMPNLVPKMSSLIHSWASWILYFALRQSNKLCKYSIFWVWIIRFSNYTQKAWSVLISWHPPLKKQIIHVLIPQGTEEFFVMVSEAKILPSQSYESPVFTVELTIKLSVIIKFNFNTCYSPALCVNSNTLTYGDVWVVQVTPTPWENNSNSNVCM